MAPFGGFSAVGSSGGRGVPTKRSVSTRIAERGRYSHAALAPRTSALCRSGDVVKDPKRTPVRGGHEVIAMDGQVANRAHRQVELERLPVVAIVKGNVHSQLGAGEQQALLLRIFANHSQEGCIRNSVCN